MNLTEEQKTILNQCYGNIYVSAAPGSGKSTVLGLVADRLLEANPNNLILLVTFTNKAAKSIIGKCKNDPSRIIGGTFHSIAYRQAKEAGLNWNICDESKKRLLIKKTFDCRKNKKEFERIYESISLMKSEWPWPTDNSLLNRYNTELERFNLCDFDDIIKKYIDEVNNQGIHIPKITHILVDELQDTSMPQLVMLRKLQEKSGCNMIGVSDDDQCQPGDTDILTTNGYEKLSNLDPNTHRIPAFISKGSYIGGLTNGFGFDKSSRLYTGRMYRLYCGEKSAECTYNHKWLVRWSEKAKNKNVVYLMRKGDRFRIGWCQLFNSEGCFHLGVRTRLEKADAAWIIDICNTKRDASIVESSIAFSYGIPTITFKQNTGSYYDKEAIDTIYKAIGTKKIKERALKLLEDVHLHEEYPIWNEALAYSKRGGSQRFKMQTCNLISNLFEIPVQIKGKSFKWGEIDAIASYKVIDKLVYSIDVKVGNDNGKNSKTYICNNGLVTSNSIYSWRGARPENVKDFIKVFNCKILNMGTNFRSGSKIVKCSEKVIKNNKKRIEKQIRAREDAPRGYIIKTKCENHFDEIDNVIRRILQNPDKEIAILYRNRTYKNHLEFKLRQFGISYCINDMLDITDRSAIKVILACSKLACKLGDIYDLEIAAKALKGIGTTSVKNLEKKLKESDKSFQEMVDESREKAKIPKYMQSIIQLQEYYEKQEGCSYDIFVHWVDELFIDSFEFQEDIRNFLIDIGKCYKLKEDQIRELCNELGLDGKEKDDGDEDAQVQLSTVHGYKGLERDIVILPWTQQYLEIKPNKEIDTEAERRLFYVAVTRAKEKLYMTFSGKTPLFVEEMRI